MSLLALALPLAAIPLTPAQELEGWTASVLEVPRGEWQLHLADLDGAGVRGNSDGRLDLLLLDLPAHHVEVCVCVCACVCVCVCVCV